MPIHTRTVTDGITSETETLIGAPRSPQAIRDDSQELLAFFQRQAPLNTFDGRVARLETICQRLIARWNAAMPTSGSMVRVPDSPAFGSPAWYAQRILSAIAAARAAQARGDVQLAMSEAVEVGGLGTEAEAKFGPMGERLLRRARNKKNTELSARGAAAVRAKAADRDQDILYEVNRYRRRHPERTREYSTRSMAKTIARTLEMKEGTVRDRLHRLGRR